MKQLNYLLSIVIAMSVIMVSCQKEELSVDESETSIHKKGKNKVGIYHKNGNGTFKLIYVNENAVPAHLAHGDLLLIEEVTEDAMAQNFLDVIDDPTLWFFYDDGPDNEGIDPGVGTMVNGPGTPPAGEGSAEISVTGTQRYNLATGRFGGSVLADITSLAFSTYNPSAGNGGSANRSGFINFNVSFDGTPGFFGRLIFVPRDNGSVVQDTWQEWDAIGDGTTLWRWSQFASNGNQWPDGNTNPTRTWNDLLTTFPDIKMQSGVFTFFGIRVGEPYADGYTENIDAIKFGVDGVDQTFDFE